MISDIRHFPAPGFLPTFLPGFLTRFLATGLVVLLLSATPLSAQESSLVIVPHPDPANETEQMREILDKARVLFKQQQQEAGEDQAALSDA